MLFGLHLLAFLALVLGSGSAWQEWLISSLSLGDAAQLLAHPWALFSYALISAHPIEFVLGGAVLMLVGPALEDELGPRSFVALYMGGVALTGLAHLALVEAHYAEGILAGSMGATGALLTAYLFVCGHERQVGSVPFPVVYVLVALGLALSVWVVHSSRTAELGRLRDELEHMAYSATNRTSLERLQDLERSGRVMGLRPDSWAHLLGLCLGAVSLAGVRGGVRMNERYRVLREISTLQAEVDARARVELLLAKISAEGLDSLSRAERRFLRYASRFYSSRLRQPQ